MKRILTLLALLLLVPALSFAQATATSDTDDITSSHGPALWPPGERYMDDIQSNINGISRGGYTVDGLSTEYLFEFTPNITVQSATGTTITTPLWNTALVGGTTRSIFIPTTGFDTLVVSAFAESDGTAGLEAPSTAASGGVAVLGTAFGEADRWTGGDSAGAADLFDPLTLFSFPKVSAGILPASATVVSTTDIYYTDLRGGIKGVHLRPSGLVDSTTLWVRVNLSKD